MTEKHRNPTLMDALPYSDPPAPEQYEEYAAKLVEEEMKRVQAPRERTLPPLKFRTASMQKAYEQQQSGNSPRFSFTEQPVVTPKSKNVEEWRQAVKRARTEYERERMRGVALQVEKDTSRVGNQYKAWNALLDAELKIQQSVLQAQQKTVEAVNIRRQQHQQGAGRRLQVLDTQFKSLREKQAQLRSAIAEMEAELK